MLRAAHTADSPGPPGRLFHGDRTQNSGLRTGASFLPRPLKSPDNAVAATVRALTIILIILRVNETRESARARARCRGMPFLCRTEILTAIDWRRRSIALANGTYIYRRPTKKHTALGRFNWLTGRLSVRRTHRRNPARASIYLTTLNFKRFRVKTILRI